MIILTVLSQYQGILSIFKINIKNIVVFTHLITLATPTPSDAQEVVSHNQNVQYLLILTDMKLHYHAKIFSCTAQTYIALVAMQHIYDV